MMPRAGKGAPGLRRRRGRWWLAWGFVTLAMATAQALAAPRGMIDPVRRAPEIPLTTTEGEEFRLSGHRGEVVVIVFGYTLCPDVCPVTLARLAQLRTRLAADADRLRVVFVTLDPERDTTDRVRAYLRGFDPAFVGLTGTATELAHVRDAYGVVVGRRGAAGPGYLVDHSTLVFVVDQAGQLRFMFPAGASVEEMRQAIAAAIGLETP